MHALDFCSALFEIAGEARSNPHKLMADVVSVLARYNLDDGAERFHTVEQVRDYLSCDTDRADAACTALESLLFVDIALGGLLTWKLAKAVQIVANDECWHDGIPAGFERFWKAYVPGPSPKGGTCGKGPKAKAMSLFRKYVKTPDMMRQMAEAAARQSAAGWPAHNGCSPMVTTWLNAREWEDDEDGEATEILTADPRERQRADLLDKVRRRVITDKEAETRFGGPL